MVLPPQTAWRRPASAATVVLLLATSWLAVHEGVAADSGASAASGWLAGWERRFDVAVTNVTTEAATLRLTFDSEQEIARGTMRSDCGDVRVTGDDGVGLLAHWLAYGCGATDTVVMVRATGLTVGHVNALFVYHGNASATDSSDADAIAGAATTFDDGTLQGWTDSERPYGGVTSAQSTCIARGIYTAATVVADRGGFVASKGPEEGSGHLCTAGIERVVAVPAGDAVHVHALYRAQGTYGGANAHVTNAGISILAGAVPADPPVEIGRKIERHAGLTDSGWRPTGVVSAVPSAGDSHVTVALATWDGWLNDWDKVVAFDDVRVWTSPANGPVATVTKQEATFTLVEPTADDGALRVEWEGDRALEPGERFVVYRAAVPGGTFALVYDGPEASFTDTDFASCGNGLQRVQYAVTIRDSAGQGDYTYSDVVSPCARTFLLHALNERYDFYWGPLAYDNTDGAPDEPEWTLADLRAGPGDPTWFAVRPFEFACCSQFVFDLDSRQQGTVPADIRFAFSDLVDPYRSIHLVDKWAKKIDHLGVVGLQFQGARYGGVPTFDEARDNAARVNLDSVARMYASLKDGAFEKDVTTVASGGLIVDEARAALQSTGLETLHFRMGLPLPTLGSDSIVKKKALTVDVPGFGDVDLAAAALNFTYELGLGGFAGGQVDFVPDSFVPFAVTAGGVVDFDASASLVVRGDLLGVSAKGSASGAFAVEAAAEVILALADAAEGNTVRSSFTGYAYSDIGYVTVLLRLGPVDIDLGPVSGSVKLGPFSRSTTWDVSEWVDEHLDWAGMAFVAGPTHVDTGGVAVYRLTAPAGSAQPGGPAVAASGRVAVPDGVLPPEDLVVAFELEGEPGAVLDATLTRPVAAFLPNGSIDVRPWAVTLRNVTLDAGGHARLVLDPVAVQDVVTAVTRDANLSFETAVVAVNAGLDLNGDGVADADQTALASDGRAPTRLVARFADGNDGARALATGEAVRFTTAVQDAFGVAAPAAAGSVTFSVDASPLATVPVVAGVASWHGALSADLEGWRDFTAVYAGDAAHRAARGTARIDVVDRAPHVVLTEPRPFQEVNVTTTTTVNVTATVDALDLDASSGRYRFGDGAWAPLAVNGSTLATTVDVGPLGLDLAEGYHKVTVAAADLGGLTDHATGVVLMNLRAPLVNVQVEDGVVASGGSVNVTWASDEPVGAFLDVRRIDDVAGEAANLTLASDDFAVTGVFRVTGLDPGVYELAPRFRDTADTAPVNEEGLRRVVVMTL